MSIQAFDDHDTITLQEYRRRNPRVVVVVRTRGCGTAAQIVNGGVDEVWAYIAGLCDEPGLADAWWEVVPIPDGMSDREALR